jgi:cyclopropane fatty-acyl-phospholipid synthase-like methyltransferase
MNSKKSLNADYFKEVYDANDDPWNFETSEYEAAKYAATLKALPREKYQNALEVGCSVGVLTALLAQKTEKLLATDVSQKALNAAKMKCRELPDVTFKCMSFPAELPDEQYDLIMISEVAYYLSVDDWEFAVNGLYNRLLRHGDIVLVHWLPEVLDYPQTGDQVHNAFGKLMKDKLTNVYSKREENYRIDVWTKS